MQTAINKSELQESPAYQALELGRAYGSLGEWELALYVFDMRRFSRIPGTPKRMPGWGKLNNNLGRMDQLSWKSPDDKPEIHPGTSHECPGIAAPGGCTGRIGHLEQIAAQDTENPQWLIALGQARAQLGDLEGALSEYQKAIALAPENVAVWQALAEFSLAYQYQVYSVGTPAANKAVLLAPDNPRSLDLAGQAALAMREQDEAEGYFRAAIQSDPRYAPAHLHLALVLFQRAG